MAGVGEKGISTGREEPTLLDFLWRTVTELNGPGVSADSDGPRGSLQSAPSSSPTPPGGGAGPEYGPGSGSQSTTPPDYPDKPDT